MERIYFDISATTPLNPKVGEYMYTLQKEVYGNPSSIHREGQSAHAVVEKSRRQLAKVLNCKPDEIIFTSSGTEANNMVLKGILKSGDHLISSSYEHPAILKVLPSLEEWGIEITLVKPNSSGQITVQAIESELQDNTRLISIMQVNNELGCINPLQEIGEFAHSHNILCHSDAVQALGKIPLDLQRIPVDFLSMSAHKLYGPKGAGALFKREGISLDPLLHGGGQEGNLRASTENLAGIGGFGLAAELAAISLEENTEHINDLENCFLSHLDDLEINYFINGENRIPGVFNITFPGEDGSSLVMKLDLAGISISFGAACASGTSKASGMLLDMGLSEADARASVRISFGKIHSRKEVKKVIDAIHSLINHSQLTDAIEG